MKTEAPEGSPQGEVSGVKTELAEGSPLGEESETKDVHMDVTEEQVNDEMAGKAKLSTGRGSHARHFSPYRG